MLEVCDSSLKKNPPSTLSIKHHTQKRLIYLLFYLNLIKQTYYIKENVMIQYIFIKFKPRTNISLLSVNNKN